MRQDTVICQAIKKTQKEAEIDISLIKKQEE